MPSVPRLRRCVVTAALAGSLASIAGCATSSSLVAADGSHRLVGRDRGSGITIIVTTESWTGDRAYGEDLTILHMLVANMGTEPVLLAPGDFELRDRRGFRYVLYDAGGAFSAVPLGTEDSVHTHQPIAYDPGTSLDFETIRTDDAELGRLGLPWGVLLPGTQMRGFVYFEDVRGTANHAVLRWNAQTPDHESIQSFGFELHVARM